ncbi:MAG: hypothetical protein EA411_11365 [Saprospirales bacterium]|nr:MAG: hypothetical protein EA411_11365 [Saprospirales bacterium]
MKILDSDNVRIGFCKGEGPGRGRNHFIPEKILENQQYPPEMIYSRLNQGRGLANNSPPHQFTTEKAESPMHN